MWNNIWPIFCKSLLRKIKYFEIIYTNTTTFCQFFRVISTETTTFCQILRVILTETTPICQFLLLILTETTTFEHFRSEERHPPGYQKHPPQCPSPQRHPWLLVIGPY